MSLRAWVTVWLVFPPFMIMVFFPSSLSLGALLSKKRLERFVLGFLTIKKAQGKVRNWRNRQGNTQLWLKTWGFKDSVIHERKPDRISLNASYYSIEYWINQESLTDFPWLFCGAITKSTFTTTDILNPKNHKLVRSRLSYNHLYHFEWPRHFCINICYWIFCRLNNTI